VVFGTVSAIHGTSAVAGGDRPVRGRVLETGTGDGREDYIVGHVLGVRACARTPGRINKNAANAHDIHAGNINPKLAFGILDKYLEVV
jgi:hypothetical protein